MVAFLKDLKQCSSDGIKESPLSQIINSTSKQRTVLELGSGCGIAGIAFAQLCPRCHVFLTDLAEAMDVLESNISKATPALETTLRHVILNWEEELPVEVRNVTFDLVLVSDCTYNSDSMPALVRTLSAVADVSPYVLIIISLKFRHYSEVVLFELLSTARFSESSHTSLTLPNQGRVASNQTETIIEIYEYRRMRKD